MISNNNSHRLTEVDAAATDQAKALRTTLPMEDLIGLFAGEVRDLIEYDSFEYENGMQSLHVFLGVPKLHKCHYRLVSNDVEFGLITLTRGKPFLSHELHMLEGALGALAIHLGNALSFQSELTPGPLTPLHAEHRRSNLD